MLDFLLVLAISIPVLGVLGSIFATVMRDLFFIDVRRTKHKRISEVMQRVDVLAADNPNRSDRGW